MTSPNDSNATLSSELPMFDVIIAGAGPTGLTLANLLGQHGLAVLLVERNHSTVPEPRAVSIDDESLRTMQAIGLLDEVMSQVVPGYGLRYLTPSGKTFLTVSPSARPYGHPRRNAFRQPVFEGQLRAGLARFPNVDVRFGAELTHFEQSTDGVEVEVAGAQGLIQARGRYLVGCDGASSLVRKKLGYVLEGKTPPDRWIVIDLENSPAARDTLVFCDPRRPCIALPGPNNTRRYEFKLFAHEQDDDMLADDAISVLLREHGAAPESRVIRKTVYSFHARLASRWSKGRVFIAGDAAHLTPPFAGQGMNSGLRDAHNLGWKIAAVLNGSLPDTVLNSYEAERRDHVAQMIQLAIDTGKIMSPRSLVSAFVVQSALRIAGLSPHLKSYFGEMKYKPKPKFHAGFIIPGREPLIGCLLPQPLSGGDPLHTDRLLDDLLPEGFILLGVGVSADALARATQDPVWSRLRAARIVIDAPYAGAAHGSSLHTKGDTFAKALGSILVVRPDRYVMAAFQPGDERAIARGVGALVGPIENSVPAIAPTSEVQAEPAAAWSMR